MKTCLELIVFKVHEDKIEDFLKSRDPVKKDVSAMDGFVSYKTMHSVKDPTLYMDYVEWESKEKALKAFEAFQSLPSAGPLMAAIKELVIADHFFEI
ncbi:MAG: hypothetical protein COB67_13000 [SAR324 cluster bacterium]|uniref:ABM domain-containing protein n=1 Tax=SAR324 cluster bacterium TaxID=2024889 RepID=A0A2A4SR29_9DELT|nr:MAG: hypothetical protein COB67_13000 [SAR324 cluster bacterium]